MKITIYSAISLDGFLATSDGDTSWVLDNNQFEKALQDYGFVVMGRTTYEEIEELVEETPDVEYFILTHSDKMKTRHPNVTAVTSVREALKAAKQKGCKNLLVIGGSKTNESFLSEAKVNKIIADIHPVLLEDGLPAFGRMNRSFEFKQVSATEFPGGFTQIVYKSEY